MIRFTDVERYRAVDPFNRPHKEGDQFGFFSIPSNYDRKPIIVLANGESHGWEHVSCSKDRHPPKWSEMCFIKELFWDPEDFVVQFHPKKSEYVNIAKNCLHLWRYCGEMPKPPTWMVGPKEK